MPKLSNLSPMFNTSEGVLSGLKLGIISSTLFVSIIYIGGVFGFSPNTDLLGVVVPSLVTIFAIVVSFVSLSYNIDNRIPSKLSQKYVLNSKFLWAYIGFQMGLLGSLGGIVYLWGYYNPLNNVLIASLFVSLISTILLIRKYKLRASKEGLHQLILDNASVPSARSVDILQNISRETDLELTDYDFEHILSESNGSENYESVFKLTIDQTGLINIDSERLGFLESFSDSLNLVNIPKDNVVFAGGNQDAGKWIRVASENSSEYYANQIRDAIEVEEIEWVEDWLVLLKHSLRRGDGNISEEFRLLDEILDSELDRNPAILAMILRRISEEFASGIDSNDALLQYSLSFAYRNKESLSSQPKIFNEYLFAVRTLLESRIDASPAEFSPRFLHAPLYIDEQLETLRLDFEKNQIYPGPDMYEKCISYAIDTSSTIIQRTIRDFHHDEDVYRKYLKSQINSFNDFLSKYSADRETYVESAESYKEGQSYNDFDLLDRRRVDRKIKIVSNMEKRRDEEVIYLCVLALEKIGENEIPKDLTEFVLDALNNAKIDKLEPEGAYISTGFESREAESVENKYAKYLAIELFRRVEFREFEISDEDLINCIDGKVEKLSCKEINRWVDLKTEEFISRRNKIKSMLQG